MAGKTLIGALRVFLGLDTADFTEGVGKAKDSVQDFVENVKKNLERLIAAFAVEQLAAGFVSIEENLNALGKAAQKIGIPVQQLAELQYAAELADVPLDVLQTSVGKLSKGLSEFAANGKGAVGQALKEIGVSALDANGKLRPTIDILKDIADKMSGFRDGANKTALMMALLGKQGAELIPLFNEGSKAISDAGDELTSFGGVPTQQATKAAATLLDDFKRIKEAFYAVAQSITITVTPAVTTLTNSFVEFLGKGGGAKGASDIIVGAMESIALATIAATDELSKSTGSILEWIGSVNSLLDKFDALDKGFANFKESSGTAVYDAGARFRFAIGLNTQVSNSAEKGDSGIQGIGNAFGTTGKQAEDATAKVKAFFAQLLSHKDAAKNGPGGAGGVRTSGGTIEAPAIGTGVSGAQAKLNKLMAEGLSLTKQLASPEEERALTLAKLAELLQVGAISQETYNEGVDAATTKYVHAQGALNKFTSDVKDNLKELTQYTDAVKSSLGDMFTSLLDGSLNAVDALKKLATQLASIAANNVLSGLFASLLKPSNALYGGGGGLLSGLFGFASGGTIMPGGNGGTDSQLVAFRKSPDEQVDITRPGQRVNGSSGTTLQFNIDARGADTARVAQLERTITQVVKNTYKTTVNTVARERQLSPGFN